MKKHVVADWGSKLYGMTGSFVAYMLAAALFLSWSDSPLWAQDNSKKAAIENQTFHLCGTFTNCPENDAYYNCAKGLLERLRNDGTVSDEEYDSWIAEMHELETYCGGFKEADKSCKDKKTLDLEQIRNDAFQEGVLSVDQAALIEQGRAAGFTAGVASVPVEQIKQAAYDAGYTQGFGAGRDAGMQEGLKIGYAQGHEVGLKEGYERGYAEGHADGYRSGYDAGYQNGFAEGYAQGHDAGFVEGHDKGFIEGHDKGYFEGLLADKVTICHREPQKLPVTLTISRSAFASHVAHHDDTLGPCPAGRK